MKTGLAIWHYPHRTLVENVEFFAQNGFTAVSALGAQFYEVCKNKTEAKALADVLRKHAVTFTVHHNALPYEKHPEAEFFKQVGEMREWQEQYGLIDILSFDVRDREEANLERYTKFALDTFGDTETKIALEDYPMTEGERRQAQKLKVYGKFGLLVDIGHTNIRIRRSGADTMEEYLKTGQTPPIASGTVSEEEFYRALVSKGLPIYEIHLHNNDGLKDQHGLLEEGTIDMQAIAHALKKIGFDGVLTIESVPGWHGIEGEEADRAIIKTREFWDSVWVKA